MKQICLVSLCFLLVFAFSIQAQPEIKFHWRSWGQIPGMHNVQILEPADPHTWNDNYLGIENNYLEWMWSCDGPKAGWECIQWHEPADPHTWNDNYLCYRGNAMHEFRFSCCGPIEGWNCVQIAEGAEPGEHTWGDNYFCWKKKQGQEAPDPVKFMIAGLLQGYISNALNGQEYGGEKHWKSGPSWARIRHEAKAYITFVREHLTVTMRSMTWNGRQLVVNMCIAADVKGSAQYKQVGNFSVSCNFEAKLELVVRFTVTLHENENNIIFTPNIEEISPSIGDLQISNDLINSVRGKIQDILNENLSNNDNIKEHINRSIRELRIPKPQLPGEWKTQ